MSLLVCGINYKQASLDLRERCAVSGESLVQMLQQLLQQPSVTEAMIVSTCNRTEMIVVADATWPALAWMADYFHIPAESFPGYNYQQQEAAQHLMEVACGLDSMVLGENQILGQLKNAFDIAQQQNAVGNELKQLIPFIFNVGKTVRTETDICRHAGTIPSVIKQLTQEIATLPKTPSILFIGASDMNHDVAMALINHALMPSVWVNRTFSKAEQFSKKLGGQAIPWEQLAEHIPKTDIIICATASKNPILEAAHFQHASATQTFLCVDLGLPRDIHDNVKQRDHLHLYHLDDLQTRLQTGQQVREQAAAEAREMIRNHLDQYALNQLHAEHSTLITNYRAQAERLRQNALDDALTQIQHGADPQQVCTQLSKQLTAKLLHHPTLGLRDMIARSDGETLACLAARLEKHNEKLSD